jgi:hypothetical protein
MTQAERVLSYIKRYGSITSREAFIDLAILDLPKVISTLRKEGHLIKREPESAKNRFGEEVHFKRYSFEEPQQELPLDESNT